MAMNHGEFLGLYTRLDNCLEAAGYHNIEKFKQPKAVEGRKLITREWFVVTGSLAVGEMCEYPYTPINRVIRFGHNRRIDLAERIGGEFVVISSSVHEYEPRIVIATRRQLQATIKDDINHEGGYDQVLELYRAAGHTARRPLAAALVRLEAALPNL